METFGDRKQGGNVFKVLREKNLNLEFCNQQNYPSEKEGKAKIFR